VKISNTTAAAAPVNATNQTIKIANTQASRVTSLIGSLRPQADRHLTGRMQIRTIDGRRFRDLYVAYAAELGAPLSEPEKAIVRQAVALQMQAEAMQQQILQGESVDPDQLIRLSGTSKRLLGIIRGDRGQGDQRPPDQAGSQPAPA
jgi:hypothetical protein